MTRAELAAENERRELHGDVPLDVDPATGRAAAAVPSAGSGLDVVSDRARGQSIGTTSSRPRADDLPDASEAARMRDSAPDAPARRQPTRTKREHAAQFACPACGAAAGEYCRRRNGRPRLSCHADRHAAALERGAPGAQPRDTQLIPRQGGRVTRQGQPEAGARSA
jgi:hypothetical protein